MYRSTCEELMVSSNVNYFKKLLLISEKFLIFLVDSKKFKCEKCESTFKSKDILRQHNKKHETEVVECSICKRTVKSCYLRKHQRVNTVCKEISLKNEK